MLFGFFDLMHIDYVDMTWLVSSCLPVLILIPDRKQVAYTVETLEYFNVVRVRILNLLFL